MHHTIVVVTKLAHDLRVKLGRQGLVGRRRTDDHVTVFPSVRAVLLLEFLESILAMQEGIINYSLGSVSGLNLRVLSKRVLGHAYLYLVNVWVTNATPLATQILLLS